VFAKKRPSVSEGILPEEDEGQGLIKAMNSINLTDIKLFMTYKPTGPDPLE